MSSALSVRRLAPGCALLLILAGCSASAPRPGLELRDCADCPQLVVVQPGRFRMGADGGEEGRPEGPVRDMKIAKSFALGKYEITQAQFAAFVADTGYEMRGGCQVWDGEWQTPADASWIKPGYGRPPFSDEPVACVSWYDATAYTAWLAKRTGLHYRLPSEAEWEYAARAGSSAPYFWEGGATPAGNELACLFANVYDDAGARANQFKWEPFKCNDGYPRAAPVGSFRPNAFGLYDMLGNVWEWLADCYEAPYPSQPLDGSAVQPQQGTACERRVARGGSWITRPSRQRVSFRGRDPPDTLYSFFGFRVARDL